MYKLYKGSPWKCQCNFDADNTILEQGKYLNIKDTLKWGNNNIKLIGLNNSLEEQYYSERSLLRRYPNLLKIDSLANNGNTAYVHITEIVPASMTDFYLSKNNNGVWKIDNTVTSDCREASACNDTGVTK
jgi:hypothetical protein